ncbi:MAG: hypothetical protein H0W20_03930 [Chthoniobacterales bacterium]|nr:hypothetical protein [Chthoniobacterales bacterium]
MKKLVAVLVAVLVSPLVAEADSTINSANAASYGANIGWMNWRADAANGVVIGEYVCSGWIYGANVGWINIGSGFPVNQIQYSNSSGTDFGVNYTIDPTSPGPRSSVASPMERTSAGLTSRRQATRVCGSLMDAWKASRGRGTAGGSISAMAPSRCRPTRFGRAVTQTAMEWLTLSSFSISAASELIQMPTPTATGRPTSKNT